MEQFKASLSTSGYSFGVVFKRRLSGETQILRLIPGGPAWKSGILNKGDVILKLALPDRKNKQYDVTDLSSEKLRRLFSGKNNRKLAITVRKKNGLIKETVLYHAKLRLEDNIITSFILSGKRKIGYIYLPSFYTHWESQFAPGCANDVAAEILRLKREKIEGLILDLRGNAGGSLQESLALSGIFINQGPLHIEVNPLGVKKLLKDPNRGRIYGGPLLIMVNGNSASASEFFAAAMQDHNRALIVGSRTFGKGTSQLMGPMQDRSGRIRGFIKFTTNMYYNLSTGTHQQKGVQPHIQLPDMKGFFRTERKLSNSISPERIRKKVNFHKSTKIDPDELEDKSEDRVSDDPNFRKIKSLSRKLKKLYKKRRDVPLNLEKFFKQASFFRKTFENYRTQLQRPTSRYRVSSHRAAKSLEKIDLYRKELNDERKKDIAGDIYIEESYSIMTDYIPLFRE